MIKELTRIRDRLDELISGISIDTFEHATSFQQLKPIEDMLDALICAWLGTLILERKATPLGNHDSAIWVPADSISGKPKDFDELLHGTPASEAFMLKVEKLPVQERSFH